MNGCKCDGFGYFFGREIRTWKRRPLDVLECLECGRPSIFQRMWYWWYGYTSNEQVRMYEKEAE